MDYIRTTPRNPIYGLLADQLEKLYSPTQTQQMQGLMRLLMVPEVSKTMNLLAYGEPLTTGAGGIGGTTRVKPEVLDAAMAVAPMAPVAGRAATGTARMVGQEMADRLTTGRSMLPSLLAEPKSAMFAVEPNAPRININKGIYKDELTMEEMLKVKDIPTVDRVRQSIDLVGEKEFENLVNAQFKKYKPTDQDQEAMLVESVTLQILGKAQRSPYPQQAALDTAQKNAALPISEGGLGLPPTNTPMDRAMAMGFDVENPQYHATDVDFRSINPSSRGKMGAGVYTSPDVQYAEKYSALENRRVLPMMSKGYYADANKRTDIFDKVREDAFANNPNLTSRELHDLVAQEMQSRGYSGFDVDKERLTFNPSDLRSTFAAFDPMRRNESDILAGLLPASLLADPETRRKLDEELSLLYTK
jgi:hypothetical protein